MKCSGNKTERLPPNITLIDETTVSLAINPVNNETEACQFPKPKGLNTGAKKPPIDDNMLLFTSVIPEKLKFDKNHKTTLIAKINVPAFIIKLLLFS